MNKVLTADNNYSKAQTGFRLCLNNFCLPLYEFLKSKTNLSL